MKAQDLRKKLYELWRRRAVTVFTAAVIFCAGMAATDWAGAIYILTGNEGDAIMLDSAPAKVPDYAKKILYKANGTQGYDLHLATGQTVTIRHEGKTLTIRCKRETISHLLDRVGIVPGPLEMVGVDIHEGGVDITVSSDLIYYDRVVEEVVHDTVRVANPSLEKGTEQVIQEGSDGIRAAILGNLEEIEAGRRPAVVSRPRYQLYKKHPKYTGLMALYVHYLYVLGKIEKRQYPPRMTAQMRKDVMATTRLSPVSGT